MTEHRDGCGCVVDRRKLVLGAAGTLASAGLAKSFGWPAAASASTTARAGNDVLPAPSPIPGGIQPPGAPLLHIFLPGPTNITLPFSGIQLMGLDVEASTITNFKGSSALAYLIGTAKGSDGKTYNLEADIRAFEGEYVAGGRTQRGAFALI